MLILNAYIVPFVFKVAERSTNSLSSYQIMIEQYSQCPSEPGANTEAQLLGYRLS